MAQYDAKILDIGQANIHDTLSLGILFEVQSGANSASVLKELLFRSYELGISAKFSPISSDNNESLYRYVTQKRHQYKSGVMTSDEIKKLRDMNFIFYPELNHYFKAQNKTDRDYLIKILINL